MRGSSITRICRSTFIAGPLCFRQRRSDLCRIRNSTGCRTGRIPVTGGFALNLEDPQPVFGAEPPPGRLGHNLRWAPGALGAAGPGGLVAIQACGIEEIFDEWLRSMHEPRYRELISDLCRIRNSTGCRTGRIPVTGGFALNLVRFKPAESRKFLTSGYARCTNHGIGS